MQMGQEQIIKRNIVAMNLTKDTCEEGSFSEFISSRANVMLHEHNKKIYQDLFMPANLIEAFYAGEDYREFSHIERGKDDKLMCLVSTAYTYLNEKTGDIEGRFNVNDMTTQYLGERMPEFLYKKEYDAVGLIDTVVSKISMQMINLEEIKVSESEMRIDYATRCMQVWLPHIEEAQKELFLENANISNIISELDENNEYIFTIDYIDSKNHKRLKRFRYCWFEQENGVILVSVEDVTALKETDLLTGGLNRRGFIHNVAEHLEESGADEEFAVLFLDLKGFKAVNELFGSASGDRVLRDVYHALKTSKLKPRYIARTEADHFMCLIEKEKLDFAHLEKMCARNFEQNGKSLQLLAKCGIYYVEDKTMNVNHMCDYAKLAKEYVKDDFSKPYSIYSDSMKNAYMDKTEIFNGLKTAIENKELKVYYQPIYDATTRQLASAEALIRWQHPERGMISPGLFVPALEENGAISQVDYFVAKEVKTFLEDRNEQGLKIVPVSVNLSQMDFFDVTMIEAILEDVRNSTLEKGMSRFEITETSYASLAENKLAMLSTLRQMEVKILLDDFGSGYSSFSTIQDYDFDIIKLDMGFVKKIDVNNKANSIIHSIIDMAHHVGAKVVAEGVETENQLDFLQRHGCDYIQGYYFSKPLPQEEFRALLDAQNA